MKPLQCDQAELFISLKVDGEPLPEDGESRLEAHLASCSSCQHLLETERNQSEVLHAAIRCETTRSSRSPAGTTTLDEFASKVVRTAQTRPSRGDPVWGRNRTVWPLVALAATLALTCGLWLLRDFGAVNQEQPWAPEIVFQEKTSGLDSVLTHDSSPLLFSTTDHTRALGKVRLNQRHKARQPWAPEIVFQEETSGLDFVPTPDGSPWGVETRRLREVILRPDLERAAKKRGRLEVERIERHPIKLIRWDYR